MIGHKKKARGVLASLVTLLALVATLLVATPASARPLAPAGAMVPTADNSGPCGATMPAVPMPGWTRDAQRIYKDDGTTKVQTIDFRVTPETGLDLCVWNDFMPGTLYRGYIDWPNPDMTLGTTPGWLHVDCPQDGQQHYYWFGLIPWDSIHYVGDYNRYITWMHQGYMTCGTPAPPSSVSPSPTVLQPGMSYQQATKVCRLRGARWVARKKPRWRVIQRWNRTNDPDRVIWRCVKVRPGRPSIRS